MSAPDHLLVISSRYPFGSQEAYLGTELAALREYVPNITVAPLRSHGAVPLQRVPGGIDVLGWPLGGAQTYWRALTAFATAPRSVLRVIYALLVSHDPGKIKNLAVLPKALALGAWARRNGVTHVHGYWLSTPSTAAFVIGSLAGIPWSATAHRWDIYERNALDVKAKSASFIRTISTRGFTDVRARTPQRTRVVELRLGADIPADAAQARSKARARPFHILSPAALVPVKGHADLLEAIARLRAEHLDLRCTFAGTGPERDSLEKQARALGVDGVVTFAGHVAHEQLLDWYRHGTVDAVVLASRADAPAMMEGLPSALIEALAFSVPVVATDSGSIGELLAGDCGYLVPARSPARLADAIRTVYEAPVPALERAQRGRERVSLLHDARTQMRALAALLSPLEVHS
jgi:glycosyltransferase involved in cell wall biosynthesis